MQVVFLSSKLSFKLSAPVCLIHFLNLLQSTWHYFLHVYLILVCSMDTLCGLGELI